MRRPARPRPASSSPTPPRSPSWRAGRRRRTAAHRRVPIPVLAPRPVVRSCSCSVTAVWAGSRGCWSGRWPSRWPRTQPARWSSCGGPKESRRRVVAGRRGGRRVPDQRCRYRVRVRGRRGPAGAAGGGAHAGPTGCSNPRWPRGRLGRCPSPRSGRCCPSGWPGGRRSTPTSPVERLVIRDSPARSLLAQAARAQLVVVGSRGHGAFAGLVLGSVSHAVLHRSPCPVAIVRPDAEDRPPTIAIVTRGSSTDRSARTIPRECDRDDVVVWQRYERLGAALMTVSTVLIWGLITLGLIALACYFGRGNRSIVRRLTAEQLQAERFALGYIDEQDWPSGTKPDAPRTYRSSSSSPSGPDRPRTPRQPPCGGRRRSSGRTPSRSAPDSAASHGRALGGK